MTCLTDVNHYLSLATPEPASGYMNGVATVVVTEAVYEPTSMDSLLKANVTTVASEFQHRAPEIMLFFNESNWSLHGK